MKYLITLMALFLLSCSTKKCYSTNPPGEPARYFCEGDHEYSNDPYQ